MTKSKDSREAPDKAARQTTTASNSKSGKSAESNNDCFVIMPISDHPDYENGHFGHVYRDIIAPACVAAGFKPVRADENRGTNVIQHEILKQLITSPLAICDLSTRNPNVMFELGLRQAFDKPVVLIQDENTPKIFDISMFRYTSYRSRRKYDEVLIDQASIEAAIHQTIKDSKDGSGVNSLIKFLSIEKALSDLPASDNPERDVILGMQRQLDEIMRELNRMSVRDSRSRMEYSNAVLEYSKDEQLLKFLTDNSSVDPLELVSNVLSPYREIVISRILKNNLSEEALRIRGLRLNSKMQAEYSILIKDLISRFSPLVKSPD